MVIYILPKGTKPTEKPTEGKKMTKAEKIIQEIAKKEILAIESRGDLETRRSDGEDFFEVAVWELKKALLEAYNAGKNSK